ncbi:MAG: GNAT family N-acetyltransferase [Bacteroidales bacterium]|nr:GNAT family N-acetyltransferase [Bacteroidales bacterium]
MELVKLQHLSKSEKAQILSLWNNEYPKKLSFNSHEDFENYLIKLSEQSHILLIDKNNKIRGWYIDFKRDDEKWFVILIDSKIHGKGFGTKLLKAAKEKEVELNGWVIDKNNEIKKNGELYTSPLSFYLKNEFEVLSKFRLELDMISAIKIYWKK